MATCNDGSDVAPATTVVRRQRREAGNGSSSFADWENAKYNLTFNFFSRSHQSQKKLFPTLLRGFRQLLLLFIFLSGFDEPLAGDGMVAPQP